MGNKRKNKKKSNIKDTRGYSTGERKLGLSSSRSSKTPHDNNSNVVVRSDSSCHNKKGVESLLSSASHLETLKGLVVPSSSDLDNSTYRGTNHEDNLTWKSRNGASYYQMDNKRLVTKLTNLYQSLLLQYHFTDEQIQLMLKHCCYSSETTTDNDKQISLECALDWACWNLSTEELPTLFTDATSVQWTTDTNNCNGLTVVMAPKHTNSNHSIETNQYETTMPQDDTIQLPSITLNQSGTQTNKQRHDDTADISNKTELDKETKQWILSQYNEDENEDDVYDEPVVADSEVETKYKTDEIKSNITSAETSYCEKEENVVVTNTYLESKLNSLKQEVSEDEALLNNEASLYMMSKYEVKELKKALGKKKGQLKKLQSKYDKEKAQQQSQVEIEKVPEESQIDDTKLLEEDEEDYCGFGLFDSGEDDEQVVDNVNNRSTAIIPSQIQNACSEINDSNNVEEKTASRLHSIPNTNIPSIPKNWTGQTPTKILQEHLKKQSYPKPIFQKLSSPLSSGKNGCKLIIKTQHQSTNGKNNKANIEDTTTASCIQIEEFGPFYSYQDAQHFVSTIALYELDKNKPFYHILPPLFRDLWKTWLKEMKTEQDTTLQNKQLVLDEKIRCIIEAVHELIVKDGINNSNSSSRSNNNMLESNRKKEEEKYFVSTIVDDPKVEDWEEVEANLIDDKKNFNRAEYICTENGIEMRDEFIHRQNTDTTYEKMIEFRTILPIYKYKKSLLDTISSNPVTILCAETGAGKTTQCPQYLLEDAILAGFGDQISILCTQPRRISAISVAERVADEMCENKIGKLVGYQIRMESKRSHHTKLMFCTTGVVLRRLQDDPNLTGITHVIVDEVHERQWQIDFLLIALRRLINTTRKDLRVILMSATMDARLFSSFFHGAPLISVPGRTFPVEEYFLEDLIDATDHIIEEGSKYAIREYRGLEEKSSMWVSGRGGEKRRQNVSLESELQSIDISDDFVGYKISTRRSLERVDEKVINYDLIEDVLNLLLVEPQKNQTILPPNKTVQSFPNGSILIFLPGMGEIRTLMERLKYSRAFGDERKFMLIPMHSTISSDDQKKAFMKPKKGCQKIILATNIAETSVTIPDVVCVIDCGLMREVRQDKRSGVSTLVTDFCSKANCKQRAGRAGRVQSGICCKLYSSKTAIRKMKDQSIPELQRVPLEEICLNILAGKLSNNCADFLNQAPQAPPETSIINALVILEEVGAIEECKEKANKQNNEPRVERLTPLGYHLAKLPIDVRLGKMLIFGTLFKCLDKALTISASLSTKSPFSNKSFDQSTQQVESVHKTFAHPTSDFLTLCNVWDQYSALRKQSYSSVRKFCSKNFLNYTALVEIGEMRIHFLELLSQIGFTRKERGEWHNFDLKSSKYNINGNNDNIISAVICAGLYPNIAQAVKFRTGDKPILWHKKEQLNFHSSSVNHNKVNLESDWVVFHEKFATRKVFVTATSLIRPFSLLLFGRSVHVMHTERKVVIDDWIELDIAAQISVMFRELQKKVASMLSDMIENVDEKNNSKDDNTLIDGIIKLLSS